MLHLNLNSALKRTRTALFASILFLVFSATAETFQGKVIAVTDGDTIKVLDAKLETHVVRLFGLDAPEKSQPFGNQSKQSLSILCFGRHADVETHGQDRYGRAIGDVTCGNRSANAEQVRNGMAWVYVKYAPVNSALYAEEKLARGLRSGLWADANPIPPWEWRKGRRN